MTIFARPLSQTIARGPAVVRRVSPLAALLAVLTVSLLAAAPAGAVVVNGVAPFTVGLQPRVQEHYYIEGQEKGKTTNYLKGPQPGKYANAAGNPVLHGTNTWTIFWEAPKNDWYHGDWQYLINTYMADAAASSGSLESVFSVDTQYTDKSNVPASYKQIFRGGYEDTQPYPTSGGCTDPDPLPEEELTRVLPESLTELCLTSEQVSKQVEGFIKEHNLPTGLNNVYYLLTPPGVTICLDGGGAGGHCSDFSGSRESENESESYRNSFCSYHADINPSGLSTGSSSTILYGVIPWVAGTFADGNFFVAQEPGYECQDGGYDPTSKPVAEAVEKSRNLSEKEKSQLKEKNEKEKEEEERAIELEGPHQQEPNQKPCPTTDGFCDYGLADLIINQLSLEQQNIVTNPLLNAWQDPDGYENTDECRFFFAPTAGGSVTASPETGAGTLFNQEFGLSATFYLNNAFNLAGLLLNYPGIPCLHGAALRPEFTAPSPVNVGEVVAFDGMESDIALNAGIDYSPNGVPQSNYAIYTWNFGDGTPTVTGYAPGSPPGSGPCTLPWITPCAGSIFHSYEFGGTYEVTLTVHDVGGNTASVTHLVTVAGPPRPGTGGNAGNTGGTGAGAGAHANVPAPIAAALIVPQSLRAALRRGLAVSYSVNEKVAGRLEVLLSAALAHHLHIAGTPATGLPSGSPAELVIAKAILVTTKAGHGSVHISFSKRTAARLAHMGKLPLMLRLAVRNEAAATTTVLASATLRA